MDFFLFFHFQRLFAFYCLWFKALGVRLRWIFCLFFGLPASLLHLIAFSLRPSGLGSDGIFFLFFDFQRLFAFYCHWFMALGFRQPWIFFCFFYLQHLFAFYCLCFKALGLRLDEYFFFYCQRLFAFYCLWFKANGPRLRWIFFVFWPSASFCILFPLV